MLVVASGLVGVAVGERIAPQPSTMHRNRSTVMNVNNPGWRNSSGPVWRTRYPFMSRNGSSSHLWNQHYRSSFMGRNSSKLWAGHAHFRNWNSSAFNYKNQTWLMNRNQSIFINRYHYSSFIWNSKWHHTFRGRPHSPFMRGHHHRFMRRHHQRFMHRHSELSFQ